MSQVIQIDPADIAHDGQPTFKKGFPDASHDVTIIKVAHRSEYQAARPGDILQYQGICYEVVDASPRLGEAEEGQISGVIVFYVNHKGTIPC